MNKKKALALLTSAVVMVTMSFGLTCTAFAGEKSGLAVTQEKCPAADVSKDAAEPIELIADGEPATLNDDVVVPGQATKKLYGSSFRGIISMCGSESDPPMVDLPRYLSIAA